MIGLLATLVAKNGWPPEPVATTALVHLLAQPSAAKAIGEWAEGVAPGLGAADLEYSGQAGGIAGLGRPDVVGSDGNGVRLVLEAKFAAGLTPKQGLQGGYASHLLGGVPGLLVYLVPTDRLVAMWAAAAAIHDGAVDETTGGGRRLSLAGGHFVTVMAWSDLLDRLAAALAGTAVEGDLAQLSDLVAWRTEAAWLPLLPDDLPERVGRQVAALARMVGRAANAASATKSSDGTSEWGPGRNITTAKARRFWAGMWYSAWGQHGRSPLWAAAKPIGTSLEHLRGRLEQATGREVLTMGHWAAQPLLLRFGDEEPELEGGLVSDITAFAAALDQVGIQTSADAEPASPA